MSVTPERLESSFGELMLARTGSDAQRQALIYGDLKRIAHRVNGNVNPGPTMQTTALLHEAWARLVGVDVSSVEDRSQFMALAATVMHRVAVDHIRERLAKKRGGDVPKISFDEAWQQAANGEPDQLVLNLHEGLKQLEQFAPELAELVEQLFFVGLTQQDIAELRGVSDRTVRRDWRKARAWLYQFLSDD